MGAWMNGVTEFGFGSYTKTAGQVRTTGKWQSFYAMLIAGANRKTDDENASSAGKGSIPKEESTVTEYKNKHPESAFLVDRQVEAGKRFLAERGADKVPRENLGMEEYRSFVMELLSDVPFDETRRGDHEIISITDRGWEQMKSDPEYEAWVFGYTVQNRAVSNPFAAWTGGTFATEKFGASIEEHRGESMPMENGPLSEKNQESWWEERRKRFQKQMEDQKEIGEVRRQIERARAIEALTGEKQSAPPLPFLNLFDSVIPEKETKA